MPNPLPKKNPLLCPPLLSLLVIICHVMSEVHVELSSFWSFHPVSAGVQVTPGTVLSLSEAFTHVPGAFPSPFHLQLVPLPLLPQSVDPAVSTTEKFWF